MRRVKITPKVLVVGGGIGGIETSLQLADAGFEVVLVEKDDTIGGHMAKFDKTFPTLDCAACILTPKMVSVGQNSKITLMTWAEVEDVQGYVGNFHVKIRRKARYVDPSLCNGCGACYEACPARPVPTKRKLILGKQVGNQGYMLSGIKMPELEKVDTKTPAVAEVV
jgi:heterodisulfide reductase subunit A